jgi:hypothetical protein
MSNQNQKSQFTPLTYILIGIVIVLLVQFLSSNNQSQSQGISQSPTDDPYKGCITWQETEYHDGESVCVIGKIISVENNLDELSGERIWHMRFSMAQDSFHLTSVGSSLDEWQGKCVVIRGTLRDRSKQEPEFRNGPWMINNDLDSDYSVREGPVGLCP